MKMTIFATPLALAFALFLPACGGDAPPPAKGDAHGHEEAGGEEPEGHKEEEGVIAMTSDRIRAANIALVTVGAAGTGGALSLPAMVEGDPQAVQVVTAGIGGRVVALRRNLGEAVRAGETLAVIESREAAQMQGDIAAASAQLALARTNLAREERLFAQRVSPEQDVIAARNAAAQAGIALRSARQQLAATGRAGRGLNRVGLSSPISGQVIERKIILGQIVAAETELYRIANLAKLSISLSLSATDAARLRPGAPVTISGQGRSGTASIRFLSPILDPQTRLVPAIATLDNGAGQWRIGETVTASVALTASHGVRAVTVPQVAVQTVEGKASVFVRTRTGFRAVPVETGAVSGADILIVRGLTGGERIATTGSFILKAELGKGAAEHGH